MRILSLSQSADDPGERASSSHLWLTRVQYVCALHKAGASWRSITCGSVARLDFPLPLAMTMICGLLLELGLFSCLQDGNDVVLLCYSASLIRSPLLLQLKCAQLLKKRSTALPMQPASVGLETLQSREPLAHKTYIIVITMRQIYSQGLVIYE